LLTDGASVPAEVGPAHSTELMSKVVRSRRRETTRGLLLLAPTLVFLALTFLLPLGYIVRLSVYDATIAENLPRVAASLAAWSGDGPPPEETYRALAEDLIEARRLETVGTIANRLNVEITGMRSIVARTARRLEGADIANYQAWFRDVDQAWDEPATWRVIARLTKPVTAAYYLAALDLKYGSSGDIEQLDDYRVHRELFIKTFAIAASVTAICMLLGYPIAYLAATSSRKVGAAIIVLVLLPFWTSLLVRTTGWIVLLQSQGVLNDLLVAVGILDDGGRVRMIYNLAGTLIAMTHILLPFFILPLYSVMASISPNYMRAAQSLGANRFYAFWRVYFPNTVHGIASGALLVFILAVGYYITPALVGGQSGQMISNIIAYHIQSSLNWGLASALGIILLAVVLVLYALYHRLAGADRFRFG
jgi:putative spermidine/putrescine transport system permease protein